ncbi:zinc finger protein 513-like [Drosophila busckii]|uniref:zinc finger protein 513-like n=1 Tax=Drosophila busckii TaxID=30019 RepID=UPI00083EB198|nr:zinc finger protein 513-like [Drosophila busckii]
MEEAEAKKSIATKKEKSRKSHSCPHCNYKTNRGYNVSRHLARHLERPPPELQYMCSYNKCNFSTLRWDNLMRHKQRMHNERKSPVPEMRTPEPEEMISVGHEIVVEVPRVTRNNHAAGKRVQYECNKCTYRTDRAYNIKRHVAKHAEENSNGLLLHVCVISGCCFSTPRWDNLCRHVKRIHQQVLS